jgi:signal transduction histidine kinase
MAARRTGIRRELTPEERRALRRVQRLSREARGDLRRLLKGTRAGTLTRRQLQTGLAEVMTDLSQVIGFHYFKL